MMKLKILFLLAAAWVICAGAYAEGPEGNKPAPTTKWNYVSAVVIPADVQADYSNSLGAEVGYLKEQFKQVYVTKEQVVPGDPTTRPVIRKPRIYKAVKNMEKAIDNNYKKNGLSLDEAKDEMAFIYKVALAAIDSETNDFEKELASVKSADQVLDVFKQVKLTEVY